jgi:uncharacterized protein
MSVPRFWREIPQRYNLKASRCQACKEVHFPPRQICPTCRRDSIGRMERVNLSGHGTVVEWTRVHRPAPGYELQVPYLVGLVRTDEGPLLFGQLVDADGDPEPGTPVRAVFRRIQADGDAGVIHYGIKWQVQGGGAAGGEGEEE